MSTEELKKTGLSKDWWIEELTLDLCPGANIPASLADLWQFVMRGEAKRIIVKSVNGVRITFEREHDQ